MTETKRKKIEKSLFYHGERILWILSQNGYNTETVKGSGYHSITVGLFFDLGTGKDNDLLSISNICTDVKFTKDIKREEVGM